MHSVKSLEAALAASRPADLPGHGRPIVQGPIWRGRNAWVYRVEADWLPGPAALKVCRQWNTGELDHDAAHLQFDALTRVGAALGHGTRYKVPVPHMLLEEYAGYLAAWIEAPSMASALISRRCTDSLRTALVEDAGRWLRVFHASCARGNTQLDTGLQLDHLSSRPSGSMRLRPRFATAFAALVRSASYVASLPVPASWTHGDFKPGNIMRDTDTVYSIDVSAAKCNAVSFDIAQFLTGVETLANHSGNRRFIDALPELEEAFWRSYAERTGSGTLRQVTDWLRLALLLEASSDLSRGPKDMIRRIVGRGPNAKLLQRTTDRVLAICI